jgi:endonuclease/exonuclease/phosphatase family metal-dependent hydrolase
MKHCINIVLLCSLLIFHSCTPTKEVVTEEKETGELFKKSIPSATFKMISINLKHQLQDKTDVKKFADWIKSTGAEVIAVQQIYRPTETKPGFDPVQELAKKLDMRSFFGKARYYQGWDSGNALFSPYPIQQTNVYQLPVGKGKVRRSVAFGVIDTGMRGIGFGSTELDDAEITERVKQAYEIFSIAESLKEYPFVVAGSFGENAKGKTAAKMNEKFTLCNSLNANAISLDQHVYTLANSKIKPVASEKIQFGNTEGILVTLEVQQ